jgi:hypothetical protein
MLLRLGEIERHFSKYSVISIPYIRFDVNDRQKFHVKQEEFAKALFLPHRFDSRLRDDGDIKRGKKVIDF